jgi:hypothetical protein
MVHPSLLPRIEQGRWFPGYWVGRGYQYRLVLIAAVTSKRQVVAKRLAIEGARGDVIDG